MNFTKDFAKLKGADPLSQIALAQDLNDKLLAAQAQVAALRRSAVRELRAQGWTFKELADELGMSPQRVAQIETGWKSKKST